MAILIVPIFILILCIFCLIKNINGYDAFVKGAKSSIDVNNNIFPYLVAIFLAVELFKASGLSSLLANFLTPMFNFLGIPSELVDFLVLRPFSGSGSLAMLSEIFTTCGVDSYPAKCASVIMSCTETVFYVVALYFSQTQIKKLGPIVPIALISSFIGSIFACLVCRLF